MVRGEAGSPWRLGIIGGGPAGSFFAHFASRWAYRLQIPVSLIIFDGKSFQKSGPRGCNLCAGVISRSLQLRLKEEGIFLPAKRIMSWVEGYKLHIQHESIRLGSPPGRQGKVATVFRGNGPRYARFPDIISFDDFLLNWAQDVGARVIPYPVQSLRFPEKEGEPIVVRYGSSPTSLAEEEVDWLIGAFGVNTNLGQKIQHLGLGYVPPATRLTFQAELKFPDEIREEIIGPDIHIFFPRHRLIRYATLIPKGQFTTLTIIGWKDVSPEILQEFYELPEIKKRLPPSKPTCFCHPRIVVSSCRPPRNPRFLLVGDAAFCRYYKNGLESAFLSARLAAQAIFENYSGKTSPQIYYHRAKKLIIKDNFYGRILFRWNDLIASFPPLTKFNLSLIRKTRETYLNRKLKEILWDIFTGEKPYRQIFRDCLQPRLLWEILKFMIIEIFKKRKTEISRHEPPDASHKMSQSEDSRKIGVSRQNPFLSSSNVRLNNNLNSISGELLSVSDKTATLSPASFDSVTSLEVKESTSLSNKTIVVIGGGPAGTSFAIKLSRLVRHQPHPPRIFLYEGKPLEKKSHYNQCLGVLSPPLPEIMEKELGLPFPWALVQKCLLGYYLHTERTTLRLDGQHEPSYACRRVEFDSYLFEKAKEEGVSIIRARVIDLDLLNDGVMVYSESNNLKADLVVGAFGLDEGMIRVMERLTPYRAPDCLASIVTKIHPGEQAMASFGQYLHAFLLSSLRPVEFGAITPKGNHLSINVAGKEVEATAMDRFLRLPAVKKVLPERSDQLLASLSYYKGRFPTGPARHFLLPRIIMIGDAAGLNRPFKGKGINSAILTGVRAAEALARYGLTQKMFNEYRSKCADLIADIPYGRILRWLTIIFTRLGLIDNILIEAEKEPALKRALFHIVSGQKPYRTIWKEERSLPLLMRLGLALLSRR